MMDVELVQAANRRLEEVEIKVRLYLNGERIQLQATLPPKPGSTKTAYHQQRISLLAILPWLRVNKVGVRRAETEARKVHELLRENRFDWNDYLKSEPEPEPQEEVAPPPPPVVTLGELIDRFEEDYFKGKGRTPSTLSTWRNNYHEVFRRLDRKAPLTSEAILTLIGRTEENSRSRKGYCEALGRLAKFSGIDIDLKALKGEYAPKKVAPRDLPNDRQIYEFWAHLKSDEWKWLYGMMATYGLRPHEVYHLELDELLDGGVIVAVEEATKTGFRFCWPLYPEWVAEFALRSVKRPTLGVARDNQTIGRLIGKELRGRCSMPFKPYDLRHSWARRASEFKMDIASAAHMMGHSVEVHVETYHRWFGREHYTRAFEALTSRPDRPKAPQSR